MKLIDNWQKAWKALSVLLPFIATTIALLISMLTNLVDTGAIDVNKDLFWGYILTGLTYAGRIIQQVNLFISMTSDKEDTDI